MKKIWVYLLGILTGIASTIIFFSIGGISINPKDDLENEMSFFEDPGTIINEPSFKVFQTLEDGTALAQGKGNRRSKSIYSGLHALLYNGEEIPYYDEQIVSAPQGKCFRQVGIYRYQSNDGIDRTVPIVAIMDI